MGSPRASDVLMVNRAQVVGDAAAVATSTSNVATAFTGQHVPVRTQSSQPASRVRAPGGANGESVNELLRLLYINEQAAVINSDSRAVPWLAWLRVASGIL